MRVAAIALARVDVAQDELIPIRMLNLVKATFVGFGLWSDAHQVLWALTVGRGHQEKHGI